MQLEAKQSPDAKAESALRRGGSSFLLKRETDRAEQIAPDFSSQEGSREVSVLLRDEDAGDMGLPLLTPACHS